MSTLDLALLFDSLTDDALSLRVASGGLTDEAGELAMAELSKRGLPIPPAHPASNCAHDAYLGDLVLLERGLTPTDAHMLVSLLRGGGIAADAGDANIVQANALLAIAVGGASIRVPASQVADATQMLVAYRRGDFALDDDFDPDATAA